MRPRTLGVIGTLVWDRFVDPTGRTEPLEGWGGISYALAALSASLPGGWSILPILKVGADLADEGRRFLDTLPRVDTSALTVVPQANNRVELRYESPASRSERLVGGVPGWSWTELAAPIAACDALYVNFISGFEMELDTARALRAGYGGPCYADLHSLFLAVGGSGLRVPRMLPSSGAWLRCFDAVQMNESEFELLGRAWGDPWRLAADVVGTELKLVAVTLGSKGAAYVAGPGFRDDPGEWPAVRQAVGAAGPSRSGRAPADGPLEGDPTGCGDVWGATFFARLLAGETLDAAMATANRRAARNVLHRGAGGLHHHLVGRIEGSA